MSLEHEAYECEVDEGRGAGLGLHVIAHQAAVAHQPAMRFSLDITTPD